MGSNPQRNGFYYFSQHLREILAGIPSYGLTVIEAPSGFGKTTALREYLTREQKTARAGIPVSANQQTEHGGASAPFSAARKTA